MWPNREEILPISVSMKSSRVHANFRLNMFLKAQRWYVFREMRVGTCKRKFTFTETM